MSNQPRTVDLPKREIKIKPIEMLRKNNNQPNSEREKEILSNNLAQMKKELEQLEDKKQTMLTELHTAIDAEKENWQYEKQTLIEEAKKEGFQIGFQEGKQESIAKYEDSINEANKIVDLVKADYQKTLEQTEDVIIELAIHTAEKILQQKIDEKPDSFVHIVKAALKEIKDQTVISIYLHPANYEFVLSSKDELKRIIDKDTKLSLYMNEELPENSCIIEHPFGRIDASIDTQLGELRNILKELVMEQDQ